MPQNHARPGFHFHILHGIALDFGEFPHLFLCKADIIHIPRRYFCYQRINLILREAIAWRREIIEFFSQLTNRLITTRLNICQCSFNNRADLGIIL